MKPKPTPVRAPDQTTFTWSLPKELKAKLLLIAEKDNRPLSNYLSTLIAPLAEAQLAKLGIVVTDTLIETTLTSSAEKAVRANPYSKKK